MTLEEYKKKYPHYRGNLLSFSDKEIKEINADFHKYNENKENIKLDKNFLLKNRKWVHIDGRYYEVPRISRLGKAGIALGGAAVIACAVVLPLRLSGGVTLTEEEFVASLNYMCTSKEDRKYIGKGQMNVYKNGQLDEGQSGGLEVEVEGYYSKLGEETHEENNGMQYLHQWYNKNDKCYYTYDDDEKRWNRESKDTGAYIDEILFIFPELANNFSKFTKVDKNTYGIKDHKFKFPEMVGDEEITTSYNFTFNKDGTMKKSYGYFTFPLKDEGKSTTYKVECNIDYSDIKTHEISDKIKFQKRTEESFELDWDEQVSIYTTNGELDLTQDVKERFYFAIYGTNSFNEFSVYSYETEEKTQVAITSIESIFIAGEQLATTEYKLENGKIIFTETPAVEEDYSVEINIKVSGNYDDCYASAYLNE